MTSSQHETRLTGATVHSQTKSRQHFADG